MDDWRLLREYHEKRSEPAFGRLVEQYIKMVYWTCRRDLSNPELAEDAAQVVFVLLARKAATFKESISVSGWLFNASRYVARDFNKREARRVRREEAAIMQQPASYRDSEWHEVEPWLNDGLSLLAAPDREAILLRYFNELSTPEVARALGTTEANARKRLSRAIDRLRRHFAKEGAAVTSAALGTLLAQHSARAVPASLSVNTLAAVRQWALGQSSALTAPHIQSLLAKRGLFILMEATTRKIVIAVAVVVLLGAAITVPIAGWKIYHAQALAAQIGPGGFTDLTASSASATPASDPATASSRKQIVDNYRQLAEAFNNHNLAAWSQFIAPTTPITTSTGRQVQTGAGAIANNERTFAQHPDIKVTATLRSLDVQGDQAVATSAEHTAWTSNSQDPSGAGHLVTNDETDEMHWENQSGKWVVVKIVDLGEHMQTH